MRFSQITFFLILFSFTSSVAQVATTIQLKDEAVATSPVNYRIIKVIDDRTEKDNIGKTKEGLIDLNGGLSSGLEAYLQKSFVWQKEAMPVTMHITRFEIKEKAAGSKRQFDIELGIAYYSGNNKLIEYNGGAYQQSSGERDKYIDKLIRSNINSTIAQFDNWMAQNKSSISATSVVNVKVKLKSSSDKKHLLPYSLARKLYITDFESSPDMESPGAAATMSGIGMTYEGTTLRNITDVNVTLTVYFDKSRSWMKDNGKNVTILNHEQKHFDITALKACELQRRIEQTTFTPENYKQELTDLLNKVQEEGAEMQNAYDRETDHGTIIDQQEAWNKKIEDLLRRQTCF